ncbi:hypothetical protein EJ04DRAFT_168910 [Polyplosphaeria fusca]|uniref:Uncharacterized protein n=1 Tax=Polyplosphaeria fusca TaxID=682080 RepID=A0A9P4RBC1_9PLEO|nr:hypothetical protein EJ04DRAFT_168910 [Polyplosphaeria fusca]
MVMKGSERENHLKDPHDPPTGGSKAVSHFSPSSPANTVSRQEKRAFVPPSCASAPTAARASQERSAGLEAQTLRSEAVRVRQLRTSNITRHWIHRLPSLIRMSEIRVLARRCLRLTSSSLQSRDAGR